MRKELVMRVWRLVVLGALLLGGAVATAQTAGPADGAGDSPRRYSEHAADPGSGLLLDLLLLLGIAGPIAARWLGTIAAEDRSMPA